MKAKNLIFGGLAIILVLALGLSLGFAIVSLEPSPAFASSGTGTKDDPVVVGSYAELKSELENVASSPKYISLGNDIYSSDYTENNYLNCNSNSAVDVYLDLAGHSIERSGYTNTALFQIGGRYSLTINDSVGTGSITANSSRNVALSVVYLYDTNSCLTINGGEFTLSHTYDTLTTCIQVNGGSLVLNAGSFNAYTYAVKHDYGHLELYGGTFATTENSCIDSYQTINSNLASGSVITSGGVDVAVSDSAKTLAYADIMITPNNAKAIDVIINNKTLSHGQSTEFSVANVGVSVSNYSWSVKKGSTEYTTARPELFSGVNTNTLTILAANDNCILDGATVSLNVRNTSGNDSTLDKSATLTIAHKNTLFYDEEYHWWVCDDCGTETTKAEHNWQTYWTGDAYEHFYACACGAHKQNGAHVNENGDHECDICKLSVFTVTFDANGGLGSMSDETVSDWGKYTLPECTFTAPANKEFKCWKIGDDEVEVGKKKEIYQDTTLTAVWIDTEVVTPVFTQQPISQAKNIDGGETEITPDWNVNFTATKYEVMKNGSVYTTVNHKWFDVDSDVATNMTFSIRAYYDETNYIESDEFTLTWTTNVRQVIYGPGDASGDNNIFEHVTGDTITILSNDYIGYEYEGYSFNYWSIRILGNNSVEIAQKNAGDTYTLTDSIIVVAMWEEKQVDHLTAEYSEDVVAGNSLDVNNMTIKLFYNDGSYDTKDKNQAGFKIGVNSITIDEYVFNTVGNVAITVTSEDKEATMNVNVVGFKVLFHATTGSGNMASQQNMYGNYNLPSCLFSAPNNKQFAGWAVGSVDALPLKQAGDQIVITADIILYAIWADKIPQSLFATYGADVLAGNVINGSKINITLTYTDGSQKELNAGEDVTYWSDADHQIANPLTYTFEEVGNIPVIIKYNTLQTTMNVSVVGYAVSFNANGGAGSMIAQQNKYGNYVLPACTIEAPAEKQFKGWSLTSNGAVLGASINVTADTELFAIWEDIPAVVYTVSFNNNGGTGNMANVEFAGTYTLPTCTFNAPDGKQFAGWALSANGNVIEAATINVAADTELFAIWENLPDPEPQPEQYHHEIVDGVEVYDDTFTQGQAKDVAGLFEAAKADNGKVELTAGTLKLTFNAAAVNAIGGGAASLTANVLTSNFGIEGLEGIQTVIEINFTGATFANGSVHVELPFVMAVPSGKVAKVYYVNGNEKTDMNATFENGKVSFDTNHFSKFAVVFEDEAQPAPVDPEPQPEPQPAQPEAPKGGLSGGAIAGIVIAVVAVLAGAGVGCFFLLKKKGLLGKKGGATASENSAEEPTEDQKNEE